jgi:hypothetical protein
MNMNIYKNEYEGCVEDWDCVGDAGWNQEEYEYEEEYEDDVPQEPVMAIGKNAVEMYDDNGDFIGYCDPLTLPQQKIEEPAYLVERPKSNRCLTQTIAPWAKQKVVVETNVNEEEFPTLGASIKVVEQPKKKPKKTKKKAVKVVKETNNIFDALAEEEKPKEQPKKEKKDTKMCWKQFQAKAKEAEKKTRAKAFNTLGDKKQLQQKLEKTTMCKFGKKCTRKVCHFAHNLEELKPRECLFGKKCRHGDKCRFFHPHCEDKIGFLKRTHKHH